MNYKRSKYFKTSSNKKIKYLFFNKKSQITVVFFHGFMSNMIGAKPTAIQKFCKKHKLNFLTFEYTGHGRSSGKFINGNIGFIEFLYSCCCVVNVLFPKEILNWGLKI